MRQMSTERIGFFSFYFLKLPNIRREAMNIRKTFRSPTFSFLTCWSAFFVFLRHTNIKLISNIPSITTATISHISSLRAHISIVQSRCFLSTIGFLLRANGETENWPVNFGPKWSQIITKRKNWLKFDSYWKFS
jgi:hypothetical protein